MSTGWQPKGSIRPLHVESAQAEDSRHKQRAVSAVQLQICQTSNQPRTHIERHKHVGAQLKAFPHKPTSSNDVPSHGQSSARRNTGRGTIQRPIVLPSGSLKEVEQHEEHLEQGPQGLTVHTGFQGTCTDALSDGLLSARSSVTEGILPGKEVAASGCDQVGDFPVVSKPIQRSQFGSSQVTSMQRRPSDVSKSSAMGRAASKGVKNMLLRLTSGSLASSAAGGREASLKDSCSSVNSFASTMVPASPVQCMDILAGPLSSYPLPNKGPVPTELLCDVYQEPDSDGQHVLQSMPLHKGGAEPINMSGSSTCQPAERYGPYVVMLPPVTASQYTPPDPASCTHQPLCRQQLVVDTVEAASPFSTLTTSAAAKELIMMDVVVDTAILNKANSSSCGPSSADRMEANNPAAVSAPIPSDSQASGSRNSTRPATDMLKDTSEGTVNIAPSDPPTVHTSALASALARLAAIRLQQAAQGRAPPVGAQGQELCKTEGQRKAHSSMAEGALNIRTPSNGAASLAVAVPPYMIPSCPTTSPLGSSSCSKLMATQRGLSHDSGCDGAGCKDLCPSKSKEGSREALVVKAEGHQACSSVDQGHDSARSKGYIERINFCWSSFQPPRCQTFIGSHSNDDEERRARRRHRRRVAEIVVCQWRWFTSDRQQMRTAAQWNKEMRMRHAFSAFKQRLDHVMFLWRQACIIAAKKLYLHQSECLQCWVEITRRSTEARKQREQSLRNMSRWHKGRLLSAWKYYYLGKIRHRAQLYRACEFHHSFISKKVVQVWRAYAAHKLDNREMVQMLLALKRDQLMRKLLDIWWDYVQRRRVLEKTKATADQHLAKSCWRKVTVAWLKRVHAVRYHRQRAICGIQSLAHKVLLHKVVSSFQLWHIRVVMKRSLASALREAVAHLLSRHIHWALVHWRNLVAYHQQLYKAQCAMALLRNSWWLRVIVNRWVFAVEASQGKRNKELRQVVVSRACVGTWLMLTEARKLKQKKVEVMCRAVGHIRVRACIRAWQGITSRLRAKRELRESTERHWFHHQGLNLLRSWKVVSRYLVHKHHLLSEALDFRSCILCTRTLRSWRLHLKRQRMKMSVVRYHEHVMSTKCVRAWWDHTQYKNWKEQERRRAVRFRYLLYLRSGLQALKWQADHRVEKHSLNDQVTALHHKRVLQCTIKWWHGVYLPAARAYHLMQSTACSFHSLLMKRHFWAEWKCELDRLSRKRSSYVRAGQWWRTRHMKVHLLLWVGYCQSHQQKRVQCALMYSHAERHLSQCRARRYLSGWVEVHLARIMKKFQVAQALSHHLATRLRHILHGWRQHVAHCQYQLHMVQWARDVSWRALAHRGLVAFQHHLELATYWRHCKATAHCQRQHWLMSRAYRGWRSYKSYLHEKLQRRRLAWHTSNTITMRSALRLWTQGVSVNKEERLRARVEQQTRQFAIDISLVAPYAMRWRQRALRRRNLVHGNGTTSSSDVTNRLQSPAPDMIEGPEGKAPHSTHNSSAGSERQGKSQLAPGVVESLPCQAAASGLEGVHQPVHQTENILDGPQTASTAGVLDTTEEVDASRSNGHVKENKLMELGQSHQPLEQEIQHMELALSSFKSLKAQEMFLRRRQEQVDEDIHWIMGRRGRRGLGLSGKETLAPLDPLSSTQDGVIRGELELEQLLTQQEELTLQLSWLREEQERQRPALQTIARRIRELRTHGQGTSCQED